MNIRNLLIEVLGSRNLKDWSEMANDIAYNNVVNDRASLPFEQIYNNLLNESPPGSYLNWVKYHNNEETRKFRRRIKYRYDNFKSIREILLYLHSQNYLAGRWGSPTPNQVEDMLGKEYLWYRNRYYNKEEKSELLAFLEPDLDYDEDNEN